LSLWSSGRYIHIIDLELSVYNLDIADAFADDEKPNNLS
jgi:hypothetical protein